MSARNRHPKCYRGCKKAPIHPRYDAFPIGPHIPNLRLPAVAFWPVQTSPKDGRRSYTGEVPVVISVLEQGSPVTPGVYDTNDHEPWVLDPVDDQVGAMWMTANGGTDLSPFPCDLGKLREHIECTGETADVNIRLIWTPALGCMLPDGIKIGRGR